jgi:hypothetical protein
MNTTPEDDAMRHGVGGVQGEVGHHAVVPAQGEAGKKYLN